GSTISQQQASLHRNSISRRYQQDQEKRSFQTSSFTNDNNSHPRYDFGDPSIMSHGSHSDDTDLQCQMEMIWNWNTVGSCFLAKSWYIRTEGMMVASSIGVALLAVTLELCRRACKEYDASIVAQMERSVTAATLTNPSLLPPSSRSSPTVRILSLRVSPLQQAIRSLMYAITFSVAYIVMLLVMSFNGYIIVAIFVGAGLGKFLTDWMVVKVAMKHEFAALSTSD
ncbi:Ctr copper transporter family-domain-containing protein, partial [Verticillium dahliae]